MGVKELLEKDEPELNESLTVAPRPTDKRFDDFPSGYLSGKAELDINM